MSNLFSLLYNELFKIYIRKSTWVMYIILGLIAIGGAIIMSSIDDVQPTNYTDNWQEELQEENETLQKDNEEFGYSFNDEQIMKNEYLLENDIRPLNYGAWQYTLENVGLVAIVSLLTIIIGSSIISNEYQWGTIKLLLIRPISRNVILLSKFMAIFVFALLTMIFLFLVSMLGGAIFFGFEGFNPSTVIMTGDGFEYVPIVGEVMSEYGYRIVNLIMMTTLAFMISTIFKNSSIAIGVGIFLLMGGSIITGIFSQYDWSKYLLFANLDLKMYETGNVLIEGMTLGFSITMLIVYFVVFVALAWIFFNKRDIVNQ